ncbi:small subunit processome component 20 homolog [Formica exsecta]|uniref:small subunit processome component 20 homolog n=1 Tax=Formica exsecta TaxID=72781 RepID=UPI001143B2DB|nr:small subunit processome component 20 homolog [Formica exsecta]XP_029678625.1 small subunit processome component 20 homolog [Formica exsecta]
MKTKPNRHKETNTFRFKPFSERVTEIEVDVFHRVGHRYEDNCEEVETYFHQTLQKWNVLNLTDGYIAFKKQVRDIITLPQLIHKKQYVIDTLMEYLKKQDPLFLQPILELVVAVSRDLQKDFYEYFPEFLSEIIRLLQTKDTEQIEYTFTTLAYLFKFLWRYLIRNIRTVVTLLLPLLSDTQPVYINRFAAESFAFVGRKIKDKDSFLKLVLHILEDNPNGVPGCAKLLFEVVFGIAGQFHSCGEQMLLIYFNALRDQSVNQKLTYEVLKEIIACILENVHFQKCDIMWNVIFKVMDIFIEKSKQSLESSDREHALVLFLRLIHIIISYKNGKFLTDAISLIKRFVFIMDTLNEDNNILREIINVSIAILLASNVKLMQENSSQLLLKIMAVNNTELLYFAVEKLMHYSSFETLVLPHVLRRSISIGVDSETLLLFAKIILVKASPCLSGINLNKWRKYILDVRNIGVESVDYFLLELRTLSTDIVSIDAIRMLIILPHLKPLHEEFKTVLKNGLLFMYQKMLEHDNTEDAANIDRTSFIFLLMLESIIHISEPSELHEFFEKSSITIVDLINKYHNNKYILNAIDLCLTYFITSEYHANYINSAFFDILNNNIVKRMSSPYSSIRLTVAHLYSLFSNVEDLRRSSMQDNDKTAMELVYLAECEPATVQNYRAKLLHLQALGFQSHAIANLNSKYYEFPLRCLIGNLYVNFSLLWQPISIILASYGNKECPQFWPTFLAELTSNNVQEIEWKPLFDCHVISSLETLKEKHDDKPDFENYKILLWKCMAHFSHYAETKNRDLTGLFIDFINTNFFKSNSEDGKYCNIEKHKDVININDDTNDENKEKELNEIIKITQADTKSRNYKVKHLLAQMEIFEKVLNPKMLHREAEMRQIYLDLLSSKNADIQKAALNCLFAYKYEYLLPYKESLYGLISEKNLKNELARFKLDRESDVIKEIHRENLIPIIMRIIYAKMIMKTGMRTGGKANGFTRRKMILRFLGGTQEDEMIIFIQMAFRPFKSYVSLEVEDKEFDLKRYTENIIDAIDLTNVIPPKRIQSAVNLLAIVMEQFGGKMSTKLLPRLLRILICILAEVTGIIHKSDGVYPGYLSAIKNVRTSCIGILARFFAHFEDYDWKRHEIDAVYHVAIFPWLQKLPVEGIHSPTALLKLFMAWGQNPRYHSLFAKHREDDKSITPLPYIVQLLLNPKTHQSVINAILEIVEKLLTLQDYGQSNENSMQVDASFLPLIPVLTNLLDVEKSVLPNGINYGSAILLPHVPRILEFLRNKLERSKRGINKTDLLILSRISEFVTDAETCDTLLKLILPVLVKKAACGNNEETIIELTTTVLNLVKIANKPEIHLRAIAPLMGLVSDVPARKLLLQLYGVIAEKSSEEYRETMIRDRDVLIALNAWDRKWIDQPDFQKRLDAFDEINDMAKRNAITLEFGVTVIHNCYYFLKTESDLAMRDCAGQCLKLVGSRLAKEHQNNVSNRRYLMDDTILALTRKGITSKNETVRLQSIALLGHMVLECADVHPILRDMSLLANRADPEVDFFENMQHLQLHRRARALLKFCTLAKTLRKAFNSRTLTQFILPLCSSYLCNEAFIHKNSLVDAAIETIGMVCRLLPWHHYEIILRYYLNKLRRSMEFQKQLIRIVVAILDSFHYDLSKYKETQKITQVEVTSARMEDNATLIGEEKTSEINGEDANLEDKETEEILEEALNDENVENVEEVEQDNEVAKEDLPIIERQTLLSQSGAKKVMFGISNGLLPQLHRSIMARTRQDSSHKINKKKLASETEEDDLLRVPIAVALVKLLQRMPGSLLDANLPGIFMKLCTFLKSRMESIRRTTRETLQKIMITLGPKYLHHLLKEMNTLLTKGFQVHVLVYTVQSVLLVLKPYFQKYDINHNLQSILSVCKVDLFGLTAEEKEIAGIVKNVSEARSTKSFDIFHILAEFITKSCLLDLILPLKEVLMKTHSYKTINKITECLRNVTLGLADNSYIPLEQMLIFLYGIISESIPDFMPEKDNKKLREEETKSLVQQQSNCFIIPPEPKNRIGIKTTAKTTKRTNVHVMIEFGLKLYHILLKRDKISCTEYKLYLEPFVPVLSDCLNSHHVKLCTVALQCLNWMLKMDLTSTRESISGICTTMFDILHKYAAAGLSKGDNFDLVMATFKCMSVIVRDVKYFSIDADQLKILILYAEQDLHDSDKYATAFTLLKAIIHRKMIIPEMHAVMEKVAKLSITTELEHVRLQSRSLFYSYLMEYPLGKHLDKHIYFYLKQLSYNLQPGRLSALEMIHTIVTGFPLKILIRRSEIIFIMTSARLIDDDDPTCRKLCAKCITEILTRISSNERNKLFNKWPVQWLGDSNIRYRTLAAQLCGIFVTVEKNEFDLRLSQILPLLLKQFHANSSVSDNEKPGKFVKLNNENHLQKNLNLKDSERAKDHHLIQVLHLLLKIANYTSFFTNEQYKDSIDSFAEYSQSLLSHPHFWVRLAAAQFIGFVLTALDVDKVVELLNNSENEKTQEGYMYSNPVDTLKSLILDLIAQLYPDMTFEELADQVVKNLIFIAKILKSIKISGVHCNKQDEGNIAKDNNNLSLSWLIRRLRKAVNIEITQAPKSTSVRTAVFKFIAGVVTTIPMEYLNAILFNIMSPLVREIAITEETNIELRRLAKEVVAMIKKSVGNEEYIKLLNRVQQKHDIKRAERRKVRTQQFVVDPDLAAKRKLARQQKKKESKKRKINNIKGNKVVKKRRKKVDPDEL